MRIIDHNKCIGCGECADICPQGAIGECWHIELEESKYAVDGEQCINCGACEGVCPQGAIESDGKGGW